MGEKIKRAGGTPALRKTTPHVNTEDSKYGSGVTKTLNVKSNSKMSG